MGKRWQVGIGGTSWDVGISDLIYKGMPKMDIGLDSTVPGKMNSSLLFRFVYLLSASRLFQKQELCT